MIELRKGESIHVRLEGVTVVRSDDRALTVRTPAGGVLTMAPEPRIVLFRDTPADGAPRPGDVWRDARGGLHFARPSGSNMVGLVPGGPGAFAQSWRDVHVGDRGPIALVWREGQAPAADAGADDAEAPVDARAARIAGLRELADWLEANPDVPLGENQFTVTTWAWQILGDRPTTSDDEQREAMHRVAALIGAEPVDGRPGGPHGRVEKQFAGGVTYEVLHVLRSMPPAPPVEEQSVPDSGVDETADEGGDGPVDGCDCEDCEDLAEELAVELAAAPGAEPPVDGEHTQVAGWCGGGRGQSGVECSCGATFGGFDTVGEAEAIRALPHAALEPGEAGQ